MYNFLVYIIVGFFSIKFISFLYRYLSIDNIIKHTYIYNLSFEDGSVDRNIMNFNSNDVLLCITTGGDNILNYLIDGVKKIHTADINIYQNFLLEMKMSMMKVLSRDDFFKVFNSRNKNSEGYKLFLDNLERIKENMSLPGKIWLDENKTEFSHFIESGSVKYYVKIVNFIFWCYGIGGIGGIFKCNSIQEQIQFYHKNEIEKKFKKFINIGCNSFISWFCMTVNGVPKKQFELFDNFNDFMNDTFKYIVFNTEIKKNYFYYPYFGGSFSEECCPDYLKEENYLKVRDRLDRITIHTDFIENVCIKVAENGDAVTKAILLDHMDWLEEGQIIKEWEIYKKYCDKDCIYLWRSASKKKYIGCLNELDYIKHYVLDHKKEKFIKDEDKFFDRIGSYYSTSMAKIPQNNILMNSTNPVYNITLKDKLYIFYQMMSAPYKTNKNICSHEDKLNQFYKSQAALYDAYRQNMLHGKKKLIPSIPFNNDDTLLILAGGTGDILDHMPYANKFKKIVLVDLCGELLKVAKEKRGSIQNFNIVHHDATTFISEEKFDKIIITYSLTMIPSWMKAVDIIKKNLKYGGYLGVSDFTVSPDSNIFEKINGNLFKNMFKKDGVFLNENHIKVLDSEFERVNCYIEYGGFPLTPSLFKCPYYYGLWKNIKNINKYD